MSGRSNTPGHRIRFSGSDRSSPTCQSSRHVVEDHDKHVPGATKTLVPGARCHQGASLGARCHQDQDARCNLIPPVCMFMLRPLNQGAEERHWNERQLRINLTLSLEINLLFVQTLNPLPDSLRHPQIAPRAVIRQRGGASSVTRMLIILLAVLGLGLVLGLVLGHLGADYPACSTRTCSCTWSCTWSPGC